MPCFFVELVEYRHALLDPEDQVLRELAETRQEVGYNCRRRVWMRVAGAGRRKTGWHVTCQWSLCVMPRTSGDISSLRVSSGLGVLQRFTSKPFLSQRKLRRPMSESSQSTNRRVYTLERHGQEQVGSDRPQSYGPSPLVYLLRRVCWVVTLGR